MPRNAATVVENNFSKGLRTEATGLNSPENSCVETYDCEFDFFGRVARRPGFDKEPFSTDKTVSKSGVAISYYLWKNVTGDGTVSFAVVQIGTTLYFYHTSSATSLSGGLIASTIDLSAYSSGGPSVGLYDCQFADGHGKLYVCNPYMSNIYVTYNSGAGTMSATSYNLTIRDFEGASADPYAIDNRPTATVGTMDANHKYNLFNQGWAKADLTTPELTSWDAARTDVPSNCDVWWTFKNASEVFDTTWIDRNGRASTPAPKGHLIYNAYNMNRSAVSGIGGIASTTSGTARASTAAFHAGRVFYAGINAASYISKIYFTQILERDSQVGYCYQINDPTSEDLFDLLPADGGVISIPEAGTIYKLFSMANGLLVFAYKGVWFITGSQGIGFTAVDFTVAKISSIRTISASSFIDVNGTPMWWNTDGIFTVVVGQNGPAVQSMTIDTIQSFYNDISAVSKAYARGYFNPLTQVVQWLYRTEAPGTVEEQHEYDAVLNFNVYTKAFYPWTIGDNSNVKVHGLIITDGIGGLVSETLVVDNSAVQVVDNLGNNVVAYQLGLSGVTSTNKYLITYTSGGNNQFTWAETRDFDYVDWASISSVDYTSYFISGYKIRGNAMMKFQPLYVTVYNEGVGQAYIRGIWDYALNSGTGRYSTKQYLVWDDDNYGVEARRVKIRGQGRTLQYEVLSLSGQPFNLVGWSSFDLGNQMP